MQREGVSHCKGKPCSRGSEGGLLPCQIYTAAVPHLVLAPVQITERKLRGWAKMGQEAAPTLSF